MILCEGRSKLWGVNVLLLSVLLAIAIKAPLVSLTFK